jgi:hypothetical protein
MIVDSNTPSYICLDYAKLLRKYEINTTEKCCLEQPRLWRLHDVLVNYVRALHMPAATAQVMAATMNKAVFLRIHGFCGSVPAIDLFSS